VLVETEARTFSALSPPPLRGYVQPSPPVCSRSAGRVGHGQLAGGLSVSPIGGLVLVGLALFAGSLWAFSGIDIH
jgi:hypothetical protein